MVKGSCLCGAVQFEIDEEHILMINNCHCSYCRKTSGSAFGTFVHVPGGHFRWLAGHELVSTFESSPGNHRAFCKVCGSVAPKRHPLVQELVSVAAGSLDGDPIARPAINVFAASKAPWYEIDPSIPSVPEHGSEEFWRSFAPGRALMQFVASHLRDARRSS